MRCFPRPMAPWATRHGVSSAAGGDRPRVVRDDGGSRCVAGFLAPDRAALRRVPRRLRRRRGIYRTRRSSDLLDAAGGDDLASLVRMGGGSRPRGAVSPGVAPTRDAWNPVPSLPFWDLPYPRATLTLCSPRLRLPPLVHGRPDAGRQSPAGRRSARYRPVLWRNDHFSPRSGWSPDPTASRVRGRHALGRWRRRDLARRPAAGTGTTLSFQIGIREMRDLSPGSQPFAPNDLRTTAAGATYRFTIDRNSAGGDSFSIHAVVMDDRRPRVPAACFWGTTGRARAAASRRRIV